MFDKIEDCEIEELGLHFTEWKHQGCGARVVHLGNDDRENVFSLGFETLPEDSTGVAHILEHIVLCGSKKFPVRDPFFSMHKRSLSTFMNAMTASDFTCYPASSQIEKDFYNLLDVYLDAVFFPNLTEESFCQEGHRLEYIDEKLTFQGVVYNEMKGTQISPDTRMWRAALRELYPDLTYAHNSGGDPKNIIDLTHKQLLEFHKTYYDPSRCLFYFYGNIPIEKHLKFIDERVLAQAVRKEPLPPLPKQTRFTEAKKVTEPYPLELPDLSKKYIASFSFVTADCDEMTETLALLVLDAILMETDASPLKLALLKSGLTTQVEAYLDTEMPQLPYFIVCRDCEKDSVEKLEQVIFDTLKHLPPPSPEQIQAALQKIELSNLEITGDRQPYGLNLYMRVMQEFMLGRPLSGGLEIAKQFAKLQELMKDEAYLPSLIHKYFLNNPHRLTLTMEPSKDLLAKEAEEETQRLPKSVDKKAIDTLNQNLTALQEEKENLDCLPKLEIAEVPTKTPDFALVEEGFGKLKVFHHPCFTNDIVYVDLLIDLPALPFDKLPLAQLTSSLLTNLGAGGLDYRANLERINRYTGGVDTSLRISPQVDPAFEMRPGMAFHGKALGRHMGHLFAILRDFLIAPRFDEKERIKELTDQLRTVLQTQAQSRPLSLATRMAVSGLNPISQVVDQWQGYGFYDTFMKQEDLGDLTSFADQLITLGEPHLIVACNEERFNELKKEGFYGLGELGAKTYPAWTHESPLVTVPTQGRKIASAVAFNVHAMRSIPYAHEDSAYLNIAASLMSNAILHKRIREQGGAYGASASYQPLAGNFYFTSYRDPNIGSTLSAFKEGLEWVAEGKFSEEELMGAKLDVISNDDAPCSPGSKGLVAYHGLRTGKTDERRQRRRDQYHQASAGDVQKAAETHLLSQFDAGTTISFAGEELFKKEGCAFPIYEI